MYTLLGIVLFASVSFATSVNGRFVVVKSDASKLSVLVQINTNSGKDDLGGTTMVLSFDKTIINFSSSPESGKDYIFHNFSGGNYNDATVTNPLSDKLWINIDLPKENSNKGKVVTDTSDWTDVVTLNFSVINSNSGKDDLGGATMVLSFDKTIISFSPNPESVRLLPPDARPGHRTGEKPATERHPGAIENPCGRGYRANYSRRAAAYRSREPGRSTHFHVRLL